MLLLNSNQLEFHDFDNIKETKELTQEEEDTLKRVLLFIL